MTHDRYDNDILKALQRIANSLEKIEKKRGINYVQIVKKDIS